MMGNKAQHPVVASHHDQDNSLWYQHCAAFFSFWKNLDLTPFLFTTEYLRTFEMRSKSVCQFPKKKCLSAFKERERKRTPSLFWTSSLSHVHQQNQLPHIFIVSYIPLHWCSFCQYLYIDWMFTLDTMHLATSSIAMLFSTQTWP